MRILGIDVGSYSVKIVELESAFGRYEIHDYYEQHIEPGTNPQEVVQKMLQALPKRTDRVAVALPTSSTTLRTLQLPIKDKKAIQSSVGFELDDELPFPTDQAAYDYSILSHHGQGTEVHVAATLQRHLEGSITTWQSSGVDPDLITTEAWAYRTLLNRIHQLSSSPKNTNSGHDHTLDHDSPILLVHVGNVRSVLYLHWKGAPVLARQISVGGADLTAAICQKYAIPLVQAEQTKIDHGFVLPPVERGKVTQEQIDFSDTLLSRLDELIREIRQINLTCKSMTHQSVGLIYLAGGTSLLPGLGRFIEEEMQINVYPLRALSAIASSGVTYSDQTDASFVLAAGMALCLVGQQRSTAINLRKGQYAKRNQGRGLDFASIKKPLAAAGAVIGCLLVSLIVQSSVYQSRLQDVNHNLEKSVRSFFGQIPSATVRTYTVDTAKLKKDFTAEITKSREAAKLMSPNPHSPVNFLKELSTSVPRDVVVDMIQFQAGASPTTPYSSTGPTNTSFTFLFTNPQAAEKLQETMNRRFKDLTKGKVEEAKGPDGTPRYKVTFSGNLPEEAYGK